MEDLKKCYEAMGGDYDGTLARFANNEALMKKFSLRFLEDQSYQELCRAMAASDRDTAFRDSHTLKGLCLNLGFTPLAKVSSELCEALRPGTFSEDDLAEVQRLFALIHPEYDRTASALQAAQ